MSDAGMPGDNPPPRTAAGLPSPERSRSLDLLRFRVVRELVGWSGFPGMVQMGFLVVFVGLAVLGWARQAPEGVPSKLYAKANLVTLVIWGLWWPAIIWVTFWLGRMWCVVCPLEWVARQSRNLGLRLGVQGRGMGGWLARGGIAVLLFGCLQLLVPVAQLHRVPHYTSWFLWGSLLLAWGVGWIWKDRGFCRGFCPIAPLLSAYGRGGMLAVRPADEPDCKRLERAPDARCCPSRLNPARLDHSHDCLLCGDCVKHAAPRSMRILLRVPFARMDVRRVAAAWPLTLFIVMVSGFVTYELSGLWKAAETVFLWVPRQMSVGSGWGQGFWTLVIWPLLLWGFLGGVGWVLGGGRHLGEVWRGMALPMAVVVATGHMAKGFEKLTSWAGFLPRALMDPSGFETVNRLKANPLAMPVAWFAPPVVSAVGVALVVLGILLAVREAGRVREDAVWARAVPIVMLGGLYVVLLLGAGGWLG